MGACLGFPELTLKYFNLCGEKLQASNVALPSKGRKSLQAKTLKRDCFLVTNYERRPKLFLLLKLQLQI